MLIAALKVAIAAGIIAFSSWLSNKKPEMAGFIMALPISTMLALLFSYAEFRDPAASIKYAKSILLAIPLPLLFFVPFLLADKLPFGFWGIYALGTALVVLSYFLNIYLFKQFF